MEKQNLGDYINLRRGITYKSSLLGLPGPVLLGLSTIQRDGGFRYDSLRTYGGSSPEKLILKSGDLYVSLKDVTQSGDLLGSVARVPDTIKEGRLTQDTVKLIFTDQEISQSYVYWILRTPQYRDYCRKRATGTTNLGLAREDFLAYPIPKPSSFQNSLVSLFDAIEQKIELNRQMNETLETMARAIFQSWFVDFDPVRAKAEGRDTELPPKVAALFPSEIEDIDGMEVPKGWKIDTLGNVLDLVYGEPLKEENRRGGSIPVYGSNGQIGWHDENLVKGPGIIVGRKGNPGIVHWSATDFFPIDTTFYVVPKKSDFSLYYLLHELQRQELQSLGVDSAVPGLNRNMAYLSKVIVPDSTVLRKFDELVRSLYEMIQSNEQQSRTLAEIRDALLPKLMSGKISVDTRV